MLLFTFTNRVHGQQVSIKADTASEATMILLNSQPAFKPKEWELTDVDA